MTPLDYPEGYRWPSHDLEVDRPMTETTGARRRHTVRHISAGRRVLVASAAGVAAFGVAILSTPWQVAVTIGWDVAALVFLVWVWLEVWTMDGGTTKELATKEDESRFVADLLLISASGASLIAVALALLEAGADRGTAKGLITAVSGVCLVLSWATVNTVFILRYARLYYGDTPGGIDFNEESPNHADFAYLAFTIGMTTRSPTRRYGPRRSARRRSGTRCCRSSS